MAGSVPAVYLHVVDDVINKVRDEFLNYGAGEAVLQELQAQWEMRMMQCGVISSTAERVALPKPAGAGVPVHDLNVPYEGEEYETPTAEMLFPPTPMLPTVQTPLPGTAEQGMYNIATGNSDYAPSPITDIMNSFEPKSMRPGPYMQPQSPWMSQRSPLGVDVNVAYGDGHENLARAASQQTPTQDFFTNSSGKRKRDENPSQPGGFLPQQDGSDDFVMECYLPKASQTPIWLSGEGQTSGIASMLSDSKAVQLLPQQDGIHDEDDGDTLYHFQGVATEDYNAPLENEEQRVATPLVGTPKPGKADALDDDEPPLNEDDDDLDDLDQEDEEPATQDLVLAQFDKVTRTKSRWKCVLKDGIMHLNDRELLFNKANGEFEF